MRKVYGRGFFKVFQRFSHPLILMDKMSELYINVAKDFSPYIAGRFEEDGKWSGEGFRNQLLEDNFWKYEKIIIDFEGVCGTPSSFLDGSFGDIAAQNGYPECKEKFVIVPQEDDPLLVDHIDMLMRIAERRHDMFPYRVYEELRTK
jgi:STAS-like domain of unknown function (DUF4325)